MWAQYLCLILVTLHFDDRACGIRVGCDEDIVLASDSERALHLAEKVFRAIEKWGSLELRLATSLWPRVW